MKKEKNPGFTLIELLATIVIISLILGLCGYFIINLLHNSQKKITDLTLNSIEDITHTYILEYSQDIIWEPAQDNTSNTYTCVSFQELVNKNYLDQETRDKYLEYEYLIITRDENQNLINEQLDEQKICSNSNKKVAIPKAKDYCNEVTFTGNEQTLVQTPTHNKFIFTNTKGTNAGYYTVTAKLQEDYTWEDATQEDKTITCQIKKATPTITLTPNGSTSSQIETLTTLLKSNTNGTLSIRSSNPTYATASLTDSTITANLDKTITIQTLATKSTTTYLTFTLTPTDTQNYYTTSTIYTIGNINLKPVTIPTADKYCQKLTYNGNSQTLVNTPAEGYNFINTTGTNAGEYTITAKLKYGYIWNTTQSDPYQDQTITCQIKKKTPTLILTPTTGEIRKDKTTTFQVSSPDTNGTISITNDSSLVSITNISSPNIDPSTTATVTLKGLKVTDKTTLIVTFKPNDEQNYETNIQKNYTLKILPNEVKVNYNSNGGTTCNPSYKTVIYGETYGTLCTTTKTGYTFKSWNLSDGTSIKSTSQVTNNKEHTLTANWTANTNTAYKVEHYVMNTNGSYPSTANSTENKTGTTGTTLTLAKLKTSNYNVSNGIIYSHGTVGGTTTTTTTIAADGNLVIKLYYKRTYGFLKIEKGTYISAVKGITSGTKYYYGATVPTLTATLENTAGYTYTFSKWTSSNTTYLANKTNNPTGTFTWPAMPEGTEITLTASATRTTNTYKISYDLNGGTAGSKAPTSATYDNVVTISNPTKTGYTFAGWTFNGNTNTAKYGTSSSRVTTSWSSNSQKVTAKYFKNLTSTNNATVKLTANWTFDLKLAKHALNGQWYVWYKPGYVSEGTSIVYRAANNTPVIYAYGTNKYNNVRAYKIGVKSGTVYAYIDDDGKILTDKTTYYRKLGSDNREFIKIFISTDNFTQDGEGKKLTTEITETFTRNGTTYYGVWISATCTPNGTTCPETGISIVKN